MQEIVVWLIKLGCVFWFYWVFVAIVWLVFCCCCLLWEYFSEILNEQRRNHAQRVSQKSLKSHLTSPWWLLLTCLYFMPVLNQRQPPSKLTVSFFPSLRFKSHSYWLRVPSFSFYWVRMIRFNLWPLSLVFKPVRYNFFF